MSLPLLPHQVSLGTKDKNQDLKISVYGLFMSIRFTVRNHICACTLVKKERQDWYMRVEKFQTDTIEN